MGRTCIMRPQPHWGARADWPQPETPTKRPHSHAGTPRIFLSLTVHSSLSPLPTQSSLLCPEDAGLPWASRPWTGLQLAPWRGPCTGFCPPVAETTKLTRTRAAPR